ncbi:MAG: hypothetical protein AMXMBFR81_10630 [Chthonomonas sp.]
MKKLIRLIHAVRPLRAVQVTNRVARKLRKVQVPILGSCGFMSPKHGWATHCVHHRCFDEGPAFEFARLRRPLTSAADWSPADVPDLWGYHLHYFDDAADPGTSETLVGGLIARWIAEHPAMAQPGWAPYPISRRAINWCKWALMGRAPVEGMAASLAQQMGVLEQTLELHLLGNHYFANAKALVFGGAMLDHPHAGRWLKTGWDILRAEIPEQVLADGGHFERSPMYSAVILEDLLDLLNLARAYGLPEAGSLVGPILRMLGFVGSLSHPDGEVAQLNDSALGMAATIGELRAYALRLGVEPPPVGGSAWHRDSGFVRIESGDWCVFMDAGSVGPAYLPGHAHASTLAIEATLGGSRLIVDSGVSTYCPNPHRCYERSSRAHNCLAVADENSSDVFGSFRVGRRATVAGARCSDTEAYASHNGFPRWGNAHRHVTVLDNRLTVIDWIDEPGPISVAFLLAPGTTVARTSMFEFHVQTILGVCCAMRGTPEAEWRVEERTQAPTFGVTTPTLCIVGRLRSAMFIGSRWDAYASWTGDACNPHPPASSPKSPGPRRSS